MKQQLKHHIELLRTTDNHSSLDFEQFLNSTMEILNQYQCTFRYLRKDSHRNGHIKATVNRLSGEYKLELAINRNDNIGGQLYTIIHELTHLINNHIFGKELTKKQSEIVADTVALYFINKYQLLELYLKSDVASKWDVLNYSNLYIDNMQLSATRYSLIIEQINTSKIEIERLYLNTTNVNSKLSQ